MTDEERGLRAERLRPLAYVLAGLAILCGAAVAAIFTLP
jgi:hypothetical protein